MFNYLSVTTKSKAISLDELYIVTDVETNGPIPGEYGMISLGSVAVDLEGTIYGLFYVNLIPAEGSYEDPDTMAFWQKNPKAYAQSTYQPLDPRTAMIKYQAWLEELKVNHCQNLRLVADCSFDWMFVQYCLVRYLGTMPLGYNSINTKSLAWGLYPDKTYNKVWLDRWSSKKYRHNHIAICDAIGEAFEFVGLMRELRKLPAIIELTTPTIELQEAMLNIKKT